jgi:hypothetical protein
MFKYQFKNSGYNVQRRVSLLIIIQLELSSQIILILAMCYLSITKA